MLAESFHGGFFRKRLGMMRGSRSTEVMIKEVSMTISCSTDFGSAVYT
jgi:hypothetical protein